MIAENNEEILPKHENPYFSKQKKSINFRKIFFVSSCIVIILLLAFVLFSIFFYRNSDNFIKIAVYTGNVRISDESLTQTINENLSGSYILLIPKKNIYALRTRSLEKILKDRFGLTEIHIDKIYAQKMIHVQLKESPIQLTATIGESTFFLAPDGTILENITQQINSYKDLFNVSIPQELLIEPDENHSHQRISEELIETISKIQESKLQIDTTKIIGIKTTTESVNDIRLITDSSWYVYVDRSRDIEEQIENARLVYLDKIKGTEHEKTLEYIDVRVPGKAYFK